MKAKDCPLDWKKIDDELQQWFDKQKSGNSSYYQAHQPQWEERIAGTKKNARQALAPVVVRWEKGVDDVVEEFNASERAFYAGNPVMKLRGTYKYRAGQRDPSGINPSWVLDDPLVFSNTPEIMGDENYDSGDIVLKIPNDSTPVVKVSFKWSISLNAFLEKDGKASISGYANRPVTGYVIYPAFVTKFKKDHSNTVGQYDKKSITLAKTPFGNATAFIGNSKIALGIGIGSEGRLDAGLLKGPIEAGKDLAPLEK